MSSQACIGERENDSPADSIASSAVIRAQMRVEAVGRRVFVRAVADGREVGVEGYTERPSVGYADGGIIGCRDGRERAGGKAHVRYSQRE